MEMKIGIIGKERYGELGALFSARNLCFFYMLWLGGSFIFPIAAICLFFGIWQPTAVLVLYYSYRLLFPASKWDWMRKELMSDDTPYCNSSRIIFDDKVSVPKPYSKTLISVAPHGILTLGWTYCISSKIFFNTETKWLVAPAMMVLPFVQDMMRWTGCFSCAPKSMADIMESGCNVGLIPGGFQEATMYKRGKHRVFLKKKKGFIKYALQYGYSIMPVYAFGEELTFWTVDLLPTSVSLWLNKFNIPTCVFMGKYLFMPNNDMDFRVVVGKPVELPRIENPTRTDVDKYHGAVLTAYTELFDKYKVKYAAQGADAVLEIL